VQLDELQRQLLDHAQRTLSFSDQQQIA